ncbi:MAG: hypothetical protein AABN33_18325 [Acidobacteriota bacterium]
MGEHRASERSLFDRLQQPDNARAREFIELLLGTPDLTYDEICKRVNASELWKYRDPATGRPAELPALRPQQLTRYRARKSATEDRARLLGLIEEQSDTLLEAATKNPTGVVARLLRKTLTERAVARFDEEFAQMGAVQISKEAARHAGIEQADRRIEIEQEKLRLEEKRVELQQKASEVEKDRLGIAINVWESVLVWCAKEEPKIADVLTRRGEEVTGFIEASIAAE